MSCNECAIHGSFRASSLTSPFASKAAQERAAMNSRERMRGFNCADGGKVLTITQRIIIAAAADGETFTAFAPAGAIDYLRLQPYGNQQIRLHGLVFSGTGPSADAVANAAAGAGDVDNTADIGIGEIRLSGKEVRPTFKGTLVDHRSAGSQFRCSFAACGIDPTNSGCLPAFNADNPLDIGLVNFPAVGNIAVDVSVELEYMGIIAA